MPIGTLIAAAMPTMSIVPTMALPKPPPGVIAAGGSSRRTAKLKFRPPRTASMYSTENKREQCGDGHAAR